MNKIQKTIIAFLVVVVIAGVGLTAYKKYLSVATGSGNTTSQAVRFVESTIAAEGSVTAQSMANLHFQIAGKLVYLPFKEGDAVQQGQTIASLDSYTVQKQLQAALNTYRATRDAFDQTKTNEENNVLQNQQKTTTGSKDTAYLNDVAKRIVDQNQANLDNAVINVEIANYAFQLSSIASPINGILMHEDVAVSGLNVSPTTSFIIADPATTIFRANVSASNINYIGVGSRAEVAIDGRTNRINGTVITVYPGKVTLPNGQAVYQVDIQSDEFLNLKLDQPGTALIKTNAENVALVPAWTILGGKYIWVNNSGRPELKKVKTGKIHGQDIEITGGLTDQDRIIINPKNIVSRNYQIL